MATINEPTAETQAHTWNEMKHLKMKEILNRGIFEELGIDEVKPCKR